MAYDKLGTKYFICIYNDDNHVVSISDGEWGEWEKWSQCSASCAYGRKSRKRYCDMPSPSGGGMPCKLTMGNSKYGLEDYTYDTCNTHACPGMS